jgi:FAD/FMN-containing dehydrogenase
MDDFVKSLHAVLGPDVVFDRDLIPDRHKSDWSGLPRTSPLALARPRDTGEVSKLLAACHAASVPVVPQGGLTGISGGAHPTPDAVAISLDRMNRIESVDPEMATLTADAGVILQDAQNAAAEKNLLLGLDIGSRGSCQLGGVVSTNAGGNQVIRYGMARDHVLGLEAVLADGTIVSSMNTMLKNNAGLDLKQLFIGTEGLLGVVTRVVLRLQPRPNATATAFCGCGGTSSVVALLARMRGALGPMLSSFEVMWPSFFHFMSEGTGRPSPLKQRHGAYVIVEASGFDREGVRAALESALSAAVDEEVVEDAVLANSLKEERELWAVREGPAEYATVLGPLTGFDVGVPIAQLASVVETLEAGVAIRWPGARALSYGHIGDSNLHFVVNVPEAGANQPGSELKAYVYGVVREHGGTVSAEHGIGATKRDYFAYSRTAEEIALMQRIKAAMDPRNILNPQKSFARRDEA